MDSGVWSPLETSKFDVVAKRKEENSSHDYVLQVVEQKLKTFIFLFLKTLPTP
jgi:hypothetical protein